MSKLLAIFCLATLLITSCSDNASTNNNTPIFSDDLLPLKVGNEWQYLDSSMYSDEAVVSTAVKRIIRLSDADIHGKQHKAFCQAEYDVNGEVKHQLFFSLDREGLYTYGSYNDPFKLIYRDRLVKLPLVLNQSWNAIYHHFTNLSHTFTHDTCVVKCIGLNENVSVPAGTFSCHKVSYTINDGTIVIDAWKVGVGLVERVMYIDDKLVLRRQLKSYNID
ncbi:MAG: hypothetical protein RBT61_04165 [Candidatus Kapabacteria bacterium]|jgi:hypothetical protein|nr:hypothetical protein [Candidatus Kapabacteria bacterium]